MMPRRLRTLAGIALALAACLAGPVRAEVKAASPDAFQLLFAERVAAPPAAVYQAIGQIGRWWSGEHTYSGDAANLSFALQAGACFCERWQDNAVEHGRAVLLMRDQAVRLAAASSTGDAGMKRVFDLGGTGIPLAPFALGQRVVGLLRGLPADDRQGPAALVANADYRFPLARIERGIRTWPIFGRWP